MKPNESARTLPTVYLIDDDPVAAFLLVDLVESVNLPHRVFNDPATFLTQELDGAQGCIVSDLRMPEMDGTELWRAVGALEPTLLERMVFVTGDILSPAAAEFLRDSGCPALEKPFQPQDLLAVVAALLGRHEQPD